MAGSDARHHRPFPFAAFSTTCGWLRCVFARLPPEEPRFETVPLAGYVNAGQFQGQALKREGLPPAVEVAGVKFALPAPDAKGATTCDLHPSWLRCGLLEGGFDAVEGDAARWRGTMRPDPARIQFRVRNGPYTKLHLLAAFTGEPDTTPVVTAQFYRADAGHPVNFSGRVPLFTAPAQVQALPAQLANGIKGNLHLVTIPLEPNGPAAFSDEEHLEFELTKEVRIYRSFPIRFITAVTGPACPAASTCSASRWNDRRSRSISSPTRFAHIWTAPAAAPSYTAKLRNSTAVEQAVELELTTTSHDGLEKTTVRQDRQAGPGRGAGGQAAAAIEKVRPSRRRTEDPVRRRDADPEAKSCLPPPRHPRARQLGRGQGTDLRHVGLERRPYHDQAAWIGCASWPPLASSRPWARSSICRKEEQDFLASIGAKSFFLAYQLRMDKDNLGGKEWDPRNRPEMQAALDQMAQEPEDGQTVEDQPARVWRSSSPSRCSAPSRT